MFSFFGKKKSSPATKPVAGYKPGFAIEYWRGRDDLIAFAKSLMRDPRFQEMLAVLHHELPLNSTIEAVVAHKRVLRMIELLAEHPQQPSAELEPDFGADKEVPDLTETTNQQE